MKPDQNAPKTNFATAQAVQSLVRSGGAESEREAARVIAAATGDKLSTVLTRLNRGKRQATTPATPTGDQTFKDAESYLAAVVEGTAPADPVRVRAATCLIRYQESSKRAPQPSPSPKKLAETERRAEEQAVITDFEAKAREIRRRHKERSQNG